MSKNEKKDNMPFTKKNYVMMLTGIAVVFIGFFTMTQDTEDYGFGFLGITLGPIIVITGFAIEFFAILYSKKENN